MPTPSETTATVEHQPIVIQPHWDQSTVLIGVPLTALGLFAVLSLWLQTQFKARARVGSQRAKWAEKMSEPQSHEVVAAWLEHQQKGAKLARAIKDQGLEGYLK